MGPKDVPELPARPGCYLFRDEGGAVLYVGKARSLRARVRQYFQDPARLSPKVRAMVARARSVETIVTRSEAEALLLENTLIKRHRPRYNVLLRDDKTYPYLKLTPEPFPRLVLVRRVKEDGGHYFGPYPSAHSVRETLRLLRRLFPLRTCSPHRMRTARRPCLEYHIHRCLAPCVGWVTPEAYAQVVEGVRQFLEGHTQEVQRRLTQEMAKAAEELAFERAAELRDLLRSVQRVAERQEVVRLGGQDEDYVHVARDGRTAAVAVLQVRGGRLTGRETYFLTADPEVPDGEVLGAFLAQYYPMASSWPREVVVPTRDFEGRAALEELLREGPAAFGAGEGLSGTRRQVRLTTSRRGSKARLLAMAQENARWALEEERVRQAAQGQPLEELRQALGLSHLPRRIEGYDISNLQGTDAVASMVVFVDGRPAKEAYRRFRIRTVEGANDFASHAEVMRRRLTHALQEREKVERGELRPDQARFLPLPDLVLIDGGKGQVSAVRQVMRELGMESLPTFGLAKEEELLYAEGRPDALRLPRGSAALRLLQQVRDESHRFALAYHQKLRSHRTLTTRLLAVRGVGPARARRLLRALGSVQAVESASVEELARAGLPRPVAEEVYAALHGGPAHQAAKPEGRAAGVARHRRGA